MILNSGALGVEKGQFNSFVLYTTFTIEAFVLNDVQKCVEIVSVCLHARDRRKLSQEERNARLTFES